MKMRLNDIGILWKAYKYLHSFNSLSKYKEKYKLFEKLRYIIYNKQSLFIVLHSRF